MSRAEKLNRVDHEGGDIPPGLTHHPKAPDASLERLDQLLGLIKLTGPVPWRRLMDEEDETAEHGNHAGA